MKKKLLLVYTDRFSQRNVETSPLFQYFNENYIVEVITENCLKNRSVLMRGALFLLNRMLQFRFSEIHQTKKHLLKKKYKNYFSTNNYDSANFWLGFPLARSKFLFLFLKKIFFKFSSFGFDRNVDCVFITGAQENLASYVFSGLKKKEVPVLSFINSWDHLTFRGPVHDVKQIKKYLVWGINQKNELIKLHQIDADRIEIVGSLQFDYLNKIKNQVPDLSFLLNDSKKLNVFLPAYNERHGYSEPDAAKYLIEILEELQVDFNLIIRPYPKDLTFESRFAEILPLPTVHINLIDEDIEKDRQNISHLLSGCDLIICGPGTVAVEAMYFDKPVLFNAIENREALIGTSFSKERYFTDHFQNVAKYMDECIFENKSKLKKLVELYFSDKNMLLRNHHKLLEEQINLSGGLASQNIVKHIEFYFNG